MVDPPDLGGYSTILKHGHKPATDLIPGYPQRPVALRVKHPSSTASPRSFVCKALSPFRQSTLALFAIALAFTLFFVQPSAAYAFPSRQSELTQPSGALSFSDAAYVARRDNAASLAHRSSLTSERSDLQSWSFSLPHHEPVTRKFNLPSIDFFKRQSSESSSNGSCSCEKPEEPTGKKIGFGVLVPILVLLSGVFAGLTLGYMSLDETQLRVLMTTGDDVQKERARKIMPIRKDGHLLLTTLLIANMITNETLPVIFDPLLPGGVYSVIISTVLIVIFSELIPQSTCSRYGLQIGAVMAFPTRIIIIIFWPVAYPVSRILHWVLGPHHGIVYRRAELKELVTLHAASGGRGDLNRDTVMIVGGALDLQEKVVKQAMTPIDQVFMLPFTAKLDYPTLERVVRSGHSRIPIYQEMEFPVNQPRSGANTPKRKLNLLTPFSRKNSTAGGDENKDVKNPNASSTDGETPKTVVRKKVIGTLLVKSCVLLDPEDAVPVSSMVINALPTVPGDEPLLNVLNVFQEGRSHMAIVSPRPRRRMNESPADLGSKTHLFASSQGPGGPPSSSAAPRVDGLGNIDEEKNIEGAHSGAGHTSFSSSSHSDSCSSDSTSGTPHSKRKDWRSRFGLRNGGKGAAEQIVPLDATLSEKAVQNKTSQFGSQTSGLELSHTDTRLSYSHEDNDNQPIGIITLEDVLEELLCEEILDEYDDRGNEEQDFRTYIPPPSPDKSFKEQTGDKRLEKDANAALDPTDESHVKAEDAGDREPPTLALPTALLPPTQKKTVLSRFGIGRQKSMRDGDAASAEAKLADALVRRNTDLDQITSSVDESKEASRPGLIRQPVRSSSVPPEGKRQTMVDASETPPPSTDAATSDTSWTHGAALALSPPPLVSPQPSRPLVVRTQVLGGGQKTVIANESLLRGRPVAPTGQMPSGGGAARQQPANTATLAGTGLFAGGSSLTPTNSSRSQTPVGGTRGNRFKSQAAAGVGGTLSGSTIAQQQQRSRSLTAPLTQLSAGGSAPALADSSTNSDAEEDGVEMNSETQSNH